MAIKGISPIEGVNVSTQAIALLVGNAAIECYGVVGLCASPSKNTSDAVLSHEQYSEGVICNKNKQGYEIDIYIYVASDVKITEVSREVQKKVAYVVKQTFDIVVNKVNVFVQGMKEIN